MISLYFLCVLLLVRSELFYGLSPGEQEEEYNEEPYNGSPESVPLIDVDTQAESASVDDFYVPIDIGHAVGVTINNKDQLAILHRAGRVWDQFSFDEKTNVFNKSLGVISNSTITVVDPSTGRLIGEYGRGLFYLPHGLSSDPEGNNYWVTDVARHQVMKLDTNFKPLLVLGENMVPGNDEKHFCKPTDVAVAKSGEIFVADGYCNGRIVKYSGDGKFLGSFGTMNTERDKPAKTGEFFIPHSLTLIEDLNLLCVADRENQRIQCFTAGLSPKGAHQRAVNPTGSFVTKAENIGRIVAIREKQHYLVGITNTEPYTSNDYQIFIMDINTGRAKTIAKNIPDAHALALGAEGDIYVAQLNPSQVLKFFVSQQPELNDQSIFTQ